jgi:hypothetical protein
MVVLWVLVILHKTGPIAYDTYGDKEECMRQTASYKVDPTEIGCLPVRIEPGKRYIGSDKIIHMEKGEGR